MMVRYFAIVASFALYAFRISLKHDLILQQPPLLRKRKDFCNQSFYVLGQSLHDIQSGVSCDYMKLEVYLVEVTSFSASRSTSRKDFISSSDLFELAIKRNWFCFLLVSQDLKHDLILQQPSLLRKRENFWNQSLYQTKGYMMPNIWCLLCSCL